ncbi:MAG: type II toxin-antitoxin system RelE/ParE family toxin [Halochromatium sp.]|uniref:type II toxin-antitoxin system RelE/ParE family toxin n=1 Tax=Halochromatium sp. TaxID=2049430 RepID=UPI00397C69AA
MVARLCRNAAVRAVGRTFAATGLTGNPRLGESLQEFEPREVRRIIVGDHELRDELREEQIVILRIWHPRGNR